MPNPETIPLSGGISLPARRRLSELKSAYLVASLAVVTLALYLAGQHRATVVIGCGLSVSCFYYNLVWLYSKCNELVGGVPRTNALVYLFGFLTVASGYFMLSSSLILDRTNLLFAGSLSLTFGLTLTVVATKILFDRILRGATIG